MGQNKEEQSRHPSYLSCATQLVASFVKQQVEQETNLPVQNKIVPTEKMIELKRMLLTIPKSRRKAVLENGMKMARLKKERDSLLQDKSPTK